MSIYFFVIFKVHYTIFRYYVCLEDYMDLSPRLRNGTTSEDTKVHQNIELATTLLLQRIHVFSILEAPYTKPL